VDTLKISLVQAHLTWHDPEANFHHFDQLMAQIESRDLVVLPEMWSTGFTMKAHLYHSFGESALEKMKAWSLSTSSCIVGSIIVKEGDFYYNRLYIVKDGVVLDHYDKKHLFAYSGEDKTYKPGNAKKILELNGWKVCFNICYDLRFPVWTRNFEDYDLLVYSANWPDKRSEAWNTLLKARAIENQCYVIGANCCGKDAWHNVYSGNSKICSYDGSLLSEIPEGESIVNTELNKKQLVQFRNEFPFLNDRDPIDFL